MKALLAKVEINESQMEKEIVDQTVLFSMACTRVVSLKYEIKLQKAALEREFAFQDQQIRSTMKTKKTETAIKQEIYLAESYVKIQERLMETERQYDEAVGLKETYQMKAEMLKLLGKDHKPKEKCCKERKEMIGDKAGEEGLLTPESKNIGLGAEAGTDEKPKPKKKFSKKG